MTETEVYYKLYGDLIHYVRHYSGRIIPLKQEAFIKWTLQRDKEGG